MRRQRGSNSSSSSHSHSNRGSVIRQIQTAQGRSRSSLGQSKAKAKQRQKRKNRAKVMRKPRLMFAAPRQPNKNSSCSRKERGTDCHRVGNEESVGEGGIEEQLGQVLGSRVACTRRNCNTTGGPREAAARIWMWISLSALFVLSRSLSLARSLGRQQPGPCL